MNTKLYKEAFLDVRRINTLDPVTPELRLCKVLEEMGELAQLVNKRLGRKVAKETEEELNARVHEELADVVQCVYSWLDSSSIKTQDCEKVLEHINIPMKHNRTLSELLISVFKKTTELSPDRIGCSSTAGILTDAILIAKEFGLSFDDINTMVLIKNKKWEKIAGERQEKEKTGLWPFSR